MTHKQTKRLRHVTGQSKRNPFWSFKGLSFIEQAVEVHVNAFASGWIEQDILPVTVTKPQDKADHRHHRTRSYICISAVVPARQHCIKMSNFNLNMHAVPISDFCKSHFHNIRAQNELNIPCSGVRECGQKPFAEHRREFGQKILLEYFFL